MRRRALLAFWCVMLSGAGHCESEPEEAVSEVVSPKSEERMPQLQLSGISVPALQQINSWIQSHVDYDLNASEQSYSVVAQTPQYLTLEMAFEMGKQWDVTHVEFDPSTGQNIEMADLFTPEGLARFDKRMLRKRIADIDAFLKAPDLPTSVPNAPQNKEESDFQRSLYRECRAKMLSGEINTNDFYLADGKITLLQGCDFPTVALGLDYLYRLPYSEPFKSLGHDLKPYGRCLLIERHKGCERTVDAS